MKSKLGEIVNFQQGIQVDVENQSNINEKKLIRFLRIVDFTNKDEKPRYIKGEITSNSYVTDEDVIMIRYGSQTAGKVVIGKTGIIANNMFRIIPKMKDLSRKYLYYYLSLPRIYQYLMNSQGSSTMPAITFNLISQISINIPEYSTQQKIAAVLSALDDKIELNNQINAELEAMAKTLYDYWFVQFDFPYENGKPYKASGGKMVFNETLKREIPEGWEVTVFNDWISKTKTGDWGKEFVEGNYIEHVYCVRGADINGLNGKGEVKAPERFILKNNLSKSLKPNDFVVEISGGSPTQSTGRIALLTGASLKRFDSNVICSNFCKALSLKDDEYIFNFLQEWQRLYDAGVFFGYEGKTSGIKNFLFDSFMTSYDIVKPPKHLVEKFYKQIETLENKKQINLQQNQQLAQLRDWLLPMLMNGQVRVGEYG